VPEQGNLQRWVSKEGPLSRRWPVAVVGLLALCCTGLYLAGRYNLMEWLARQALVQPGKPTDPPSQGPHAGGTEEREIAKPEQALHGSAKTGPGREGRVGQAKVRRGGEPPARARPEGTWGERAREGVVILANRTRDPVRFTVAPHGGKGREMELAAEDLTAVHTRGSVRVLFVQAGKTHSYLVDPDQVYFFVDQEEGLELRGVGPAPGASPGKGVAGEPAESAGMLLDAPEAVVVPVKLLVDDEEPAVRKVWEARLRERIVRASAILERTCGVRLKVVAVDTWASDDARGDLHGLLEDFEGKVDASPARVAVGFTSQLVKQKEGKRTLGNLRRPLRQHILVREWDPRSEVERLEVVLHELGHYLGACHSPEPDSVMRPTLGDGRALTRGFRVGFDPLNTLILNLTARELRTGKIEAMHQFRPPTRRRLAELYTEIMRAFPDDPTAAKYLRLLEGARLAGGVEPGREGPEPPTGLSPRALWARAVVAAVVAEARANAGLPTPLKGDALTERYVRAAARAAMRLPEEAAAEAFLLGLGVTLGDSAILRSSPLPLRILSEIETEEERVARAAVVGSPTVRERRDLCQHFMVSCALTEMVGPELAETAGLLKEQKDSLGGSGFSFADLGADLAGIAFARDVKEGAIPLGQLAERFRVADYVPDPAGLKEGLSAKEFLREYGSPSDERFREARAALLGKIRALPGYESRKVPVGRE
jgi:hypothetical protein